MGAVVPRGYGVCVVSVCLVRSYSEDTTLVFQLVWVRCSDVCVFDYLLFECHVDAGVCFVLESGGVVYCNGGNVLRKLPVRRSPAFFSCGGNVEGVGAVVRRASFRSLLE